MTYMNAVRLQAQLFTLLLLSASLSYTASLYLGWATEPLVLDINNMAALLGSIVGIVFISPFLNNSLD